MTDKNMRKNIILILFLAAVILAFNVVALYNMNIRIEDSLDAIDILVEYMVRNIK